MDTGSGARQVSSRRYGSLSRGACGLHRSGARLTRRPGHIVGDGPAAARARPCSTASRARRAAVLARPGSRSGAASASWQPSGWRYVRTGRLAWPRVPDESRHRRQGFEARLANLDRTAIHGQEATDSASSGPSVSVRWALSRNYRAPPLRQFGRGDPYDRRHRVPTQSSVRIAQDRQASRSHGMPAASGGCRPYTVGSIRLEHHGNRPPCRV